MAYGAVLTYLQVEADDKYGKDYTEKLHQHSMRKYGLWSMIAIICKENQNRMLRET